MTTTDIEDVLSSIRKLVSEDLRPAPARGPLRLASDPGKLILTPALRVMDAPPPAGPRPVVTPRADVDRAAPVPDSAILPADAAPQAIPTAESARQAVQGAQPVTIPLPMAQDDAEPVDDVHAVTFSSVRLDGVVASIGAAVDDVASQAWEPEGGDAPVTELPWVRPAFPAAAADAPPEPVARTADPAPGPQPRPQPAPEARAEPEAEPEAPQVWSVVDAEAPLELDEDALREIIRDVIREELQGQLGERITRNIRKFVRSEVRRTLLLREPD